MKKIYKALFDFQQECPPIYKSSRNEFGRYNFADLNAFIEGTKPYLKKHGLGISQLLNLEGITTILFHVESGEELISNSKLNADVVLKGMNAFQVEGAAISYKRKFALASMLGLATSDNDMQGKKPKIEKRRPQVFSETPPASDFIKDLEKATRGPEEPKGLIDKDLSDNVKAQMSPPERPSPKLNKTDLRKNLQKCKDSADIDGIQKLQADCKKLDLQAEYVDALNLIMAKLQKT